jgi:thioredoxin reductase
MFAEYLGRDPLSLDKHLAGSTIFLGRLSEDGAASRREGLTATTAAQDARRARTTVITEMRYDVAVVGAGLSALSLLRELAAIGVEGPILIVDYQEAPGGFLRCALPAAEFAAASDLVRTVALPRHAELRCATTAIGLVPSLGEDAPHLLLLRDALGTHQVRARRVVIACGGLETPRERADLPGTRPAGVMTPVFVYETLASGFLPGRRAVVYGASRAAFLVASRLAAVGVETTLVPPADANPLAGDPAVRVVPPAELVSVYGNARLEGVTLCRNGETTDLAADTLVYAVGSAPSTRWLKGSGVVVDDHEAVVIDERFQTNVPGIHAIGTVVSPSLDHSSSIEMGVRAARIHCGTRS